MPDGQTLASPTSALADSTTRICIIGGGSSGIATGKALKQKGLAFDIFEKGSQLGGMWRYENDNGVSSAYRSLHIDTSVRNLAYSDYPFPPDAPDFLSHWEVLDYLEAYADHFGVREHVRFQTEVKQVTPAGGGWDVHFSDGGTRRYATVVVANGHLWKPRMPDFPGRFDGPVIHSHHYRIADPYRDKNVLVVGIGNSAVDIASDVARQARSTHLSTRRSAWIMPKYIMGIPTDRWSSFLTRRLHLPVPLARAMLGKLRVLALGRQERFGVPRPEHPIWREHATISQDLLAHVGHGRIRIQPNIRRLDGKVVEFTDGTRTEFDAIIYATGYATEFPFLAPELWPVRDNVARLYRRMLPPAHPNLYFSGLVQPIGPTIPLVEIQTRWLAAVLAGEVSLPDRATMEREVEEHLALLAKTYVNSARYTLEVDFRRYARQLGGDIARGAAGV
jgi:cation diffusion facilitator CzcD-associated flavoprotein CzcO